jgi:hypothetical protein
MARAHGAEHPYRVLQFATIYFGAAFLFHNADHLRRGIDSVTRHVAAGGTVLAVVAAAAIVLVIRRHRLAAPVAVVVGLTTVVLLVLSHWLPDWGVFSDSLPDGNGDAVTWAAASAETIGGLVFAAAGAYVLAKTAPARSFAA